MPYGNKKKPLKSSDRLDMLVQFIEFGEDVVESVRDFSKNKKDLYIFMTVAKKDGIPCKYYVCAYECIYSFDNFSDCLDKLFKTFFVFNIKYPKHINAVYLFLQHFIYRIYLEKKDKLESATTALINSLDKGRLPSQNKHQ